MSPQQDDPPDLVSLGVSLTVLAGEEGGAAEFQKQWSLTIKSLGPKLRRFLHSRGAVDETDDVVAETWRRAFIYLGSYRASGSFASWIFRIADRSLIEYRMAAARRMERHPSLDDESHATAALAVATDVDEDGDSGELLAHLESHLSPMEYDVLARTADGHGAQEIAEQLKLRVGHVYTLLSRARSRARLVRRQLDGSV